jgi:2-C-methyl-D-erythritol 4-phosphate cytidylyltransferase
VSGAQHPSPVGDVRVGVVIPAAGSGHRMGGVRKPFLELAGEPLLRHTLRPFLADPRVVSIAVALGPDDAAAPPTWLLEVDPRVRVVEGGVTRGDSVARALAALPEDVTVIAVHDAARPLVTLETVSACIEGAAYGEGAVAGCPAVDTMKHVDGDQRVTGTPDRSLLWHAHTPQVFPARVLRDAYARGGLDATDDAALVEATGTRVRMVDDGGDNLKVTRPADVDVAEAVLRARGAAGARR